MMLPRLCQQISEWFDGRFVRKKTGFSPRFSYELGGYLSSGFTLVELVSVLMIAAVLAGTVLPRFFSVEVFTEVVVRDSMLSLMRETQQLSYSRTNVDLYIEDLGSEIRFSSRINGVSRASKAYPKNEISLTLDTSGTGGVAGVCATLSSPTTVAFNESGELDGAFPNGTYQSGFPICFNGNTPNICISPAGFAHLGSCV